MIVTKNVVSITIKLKTIVWKPWMIKIIKLCFRNSDNYNFSHFFFYLMNIFPMTLVCDCIVTYSFSDACRNIFNTIKMSGHSSLEKYTSHFIWKGSKGLRKVLSVRGELETEQNCNILTPHSSGHSSISFSFSWAAQPGAWGPSLCWDMVLIPASSLQLIWTSCRRGYIIIWRPPISFKRHNSHSIQPFESQGCPLISLTGCTYYLHRCISSFDSLARVNI